MITYVFDFDSTITQVEALDELAQISLAKNPNKQEIIKQIKHITELGMEGKISITDSLQKRLQLLNANKTHVQTLVKRLLRNITPSFKRNKSFFKDNAKHIYVVSYGFKEFITPVVEQLHIKPSHVLANTFTTDNQGMITGFDDKNPLSKVKGKVKALQQAKLPGSLYVIGDGYTDYEIKASGVADKFFAFTENVQRETAMQRADMIVPSFDEFLFAHNLPRALSFPKSKIKVLLLENIHPFAVKRFKDEGYQVETLTKSLSEQELAKKLKGVSILGIRSKTEITHNALQHADRLLAIGAFCIGTNQINLDACLEKGVAIFNAPYSNTRSVVELVIAEIIMLMRGIVDKNAGMHKGKWLKSAKNSNEIRGKTLGIVGYGNIGSQVSVVAENLGMNVIYYDIVDKLSLGNAKKCDSLKELCAKADVITLHVDPNKIKKNIITSKELGWMKTGVIFLNLSRGFLVDVSALAKAIKSGKVKGCAVDVFPKEPRSNEDPFTSELQGLPNTILTPHIGGSTKEAQENIGHYVATNLISFVNTGDSFSGVNFPKLQLDNVKNAHRFIHVHKDTPGIIAQINTILANYKINVVGQHLKTNGHIGYVITDVTKQYSAQVIQELRSIPNTVRFRVLY